MKKDIKNIFIFGATGFLGYHSTLEFLKKGFQVNTILRNSKSEVEEYFPSKVNILKRDFDIFEKNEEDLAKVLQGCDAVVYSVGPDDRVVPPAPAYDFFYEKLVKQCVKVLRACKKAKVKKVVILNSYFAYFDRMYDQKLSKNHPYIRARVEQARDCIKEGRKGVMDVIILELPYIFGSMPCRVPLWKDVFLEKFKNMKTIYFLKGGTVTVHVRDVAKAVVGATIYGTHGGRYPIGVKNMKFKEMIEIMYKYLGDEKKVKIIPTFLAYLNGVSMNKKAKKEGKGSGLDYAKLMTDILSKDFFYSKKIIRNVQKELRFKYTFDVEKGIQESMGACYPEKFKRKD